MSGVSRTNAVGEGLAVSDGVARLEKLAATDTDELGGCEAESEADAISDREGNCVARGESDAEELGVDLTPPSEPTLGEGRCVPSTELSGEADGRCDPEERRDVRAEPDGDGTRLAEPDAPRE